MYLNRADYYHEIFPVTEEKLEFALFETQSEDLVLDIGCSVGELTHMLHENKIKSIGIDLDKDMILIAKNRYKGDFRVLDMMKIDSEFKENTFDQLICIGNTMVHLKDIKMIKEFLFKCHNILKPGGMIKIQIINYDRVLDNSIKSLPTIENKKIRFERKYHIKEKNIIFETDLLDKENNDILKSHVTLFPIRKNEIDKLLKDIGYNDIPYYSSFNLLPYDKDSLPLLFTSIK